MFHAVRVPCVAAELAFPSTPVAGKLSHNTIRKLQHCDPYHKSNISKWYATVDCT